jgi:hypothetical protein
MRSRALIVVAILAATCAACSGSGDPGPADTGKLTEKQYDTAVNVARHEIENQDAAVTSATAVLKRNSGQRGSSNTGLQCTSDQVLKVRLIGTFPHTAVAGTPGDAGPITQMDIKADAVSGDACLIGVSTSKHPKPEQGATVLQLDEN